MSKKLFGGSIRVQAEGYEPWHLFNLFTKENISFSDAKNVNEFTVTMTLPARERKRASELAAHRGYTITPDAEQTPREQESSFSRRTVLSCALALLACALCASSLFVWDIRVAENDSDLTEGEILAVLDSQGVGIGSFWPAFSPDLIRERALTELDGLQWLGVNVRGSRATVTVRAAIPMPKLSDPGLVTEITAAESGVITEIHVFEGDAAVRRGEGVTKGQVLVPAERVGLRGEVRSVHAAAEITAHTWRSLTACAPLEILKTEQTGTVHSSFALLFGRNRINISSNSGISDGICDKMTQYTVPGAETTVSLPLSWLTERQWERQTARSLASAAELCAGMEKMLMVRLEDELDGRGTVLSTRFSASEENGVLYVTLHAACEERIDREQTINPPSSEG